jgi:hypothetical protein
MKHVQNSKLMCNTKERKLGHVGARCQSQVRGQRTKLLRRVINHCEGVDERMNDVI